MSQEQPIKYGDLFVVHGELAEKAVAPKDAAMMQTAETMMLGHVQSGGAAAKMQSAATKNERAGFLRHEDITDVAAEEGVTVTQKDLFGNDRLITESICGQVVNEYIDSGPAVSNLEIREEEIEHHHEQLITIGEALEAASLTAGHRAVDHSDAAAIQAAEVRATGRSHIVPGGLAAAAQSAAVHNDRVTAHQDKLKICDILADATEKLPSDRIATRKDAERVAAVELRNNPNKMTHSTGVAASMAAAVRLNKGGQ